MNLKTSWKKVLAGSLAILAMASFAAGCGSSSSSETIKKDTIVVGTNPTYKPFEFTTDDNKGYDGFDMDLIKAVAKHMNKQVEIKNIAFDALIPALKTKDIDIISSGMTITQPRSEAVTFSMPYAQSAQAIVFKASTPVKTLADLNGKTISAQMGSTGADDANKIQGATVKTFDNGSDALLDLYNGGAQATVIDMSVAQYYKTQHPEANLAYIQYPGDNAGYLGLAVSKDNKALADEVNKALKEMKANGELDQIYQKWFGEKAPDMPEEVKF